jgi:lipocalin
LSTRRLQALQDNGYIIPGKPNESKFFKLLEFRGGPMYHVFTEDEIKLWRDWTWELGEEDKKRRGHNLNALRDRLAALNSAVVASISDAQLRTWQVAAADYRIGLWLEIASLKVRMSRTHAARSGASRQEAHNVIKSVNDGFRNWLGWSMIRAMTYIAAQYADAVRQVKFDLFDPETKQKFAVSTWLDRIREAPNSAAPACAMLHALGNALSRQPGLLEVQFAAGTPLAYAFDNGIPGNDGRTARDTLDAWLNADCPLPKVPTGRVRPMRLESSLSEQESHPTGVVMGFGTVH